MTLLAFFFLLICCLVFWDSVRHLAFYARWPALFGRHMRFYVLLAGVSLGVGLVSLVYLLNTSLGID